MLMPAAVYFMYGSGILNYGCPIVFAVTVTCVFTNTFLALSAPRHVTHEFFVIVQSE